MQILLIEFTVLTRRRVDRKFTCQPNIFLVYYLEIRRFNHSLLFLDISSDPCHSFRYLLCVCFRQLISIWFLLSDNIHHFICSSSHIDHPFQPEISSTQFFTIIIIYRYKMSIEFCVIFFTLSRNSPAQSSLDHPPISPTYSHLSPQLPQ